MSRLVEVMWWCLVAACLLMGAGLLSHTPAQSRARHKQSHVELKKTQVAAVSNAQPEGELIGKRLRFTDGSTLEADDVWKLNEEYWYRAGGITQRVDRAVSAIEPVRAEQKEKKQELAGSGSTTGKPAPVEAAEIWLVFKEGARVRVDEVTEADSGVWYQRDNFSVFVDRERIARIERESTRPNSTGWRERGWTSVNARIDELIRINGARFGVDPYLVFCVIEHESHFRTRAISPKGARGLMQLMPGTARHFGVRQPYDPSENIFGGTQYLKELLDMFGGRLDLALASYNAGEGAVLKYGRTVPPYRETREYVRRLTRRYGASDDSTEKTSPSPR